MSTRPISQEGSLWHARTLSLGLLCPPLRNGENQVTQSQQHPLMCRDDFGRAATDGGLQLRRQRRLGKHFFNMRDKVMNVPHVDDRLSTSRDKLVDALLDSDDKYEAAMAHVVHG